MWYFPQEDMRVEVQAVENWQERVMILPELPAVIDVDELTVPQKGPSVRMILIRPSGQEASSHWEFTHFRSMLPLH